ncbi:MAG: hypothetical protein ACRDJM_01605 [Actinomycetota bacterium]
METSATAKGGIGAWILPVLLGVAGSLGAVSALGKGTYDVAPLKVRMSVSVAASGTTRLSMEAPGGVTPGTASAATHDSPLKFGATIVGVDAAGLPRAVVDSTTPTGVQTTEPLDPSKPELVSRYLADNGKSATRSFGIKVGLLALAGGLIAGGIGALGKPKRAIAGAVAGILVIGILGLIAQKTYDVTGFQGTTFEQSQ